MSRATEPSPATAARSTAEIEPISDDDIIPIPSQELELPQLPAPRSSVNDLPAGAFVYPTQIRKSMAPLVIGLLLALAAAGAVVYFVVLKKEEAPATASAPEPPAPTVPSEPVAVAEPAIDAAVEAPVIEIEPDAAAVVADEPVQPKERVASRTPPRTPRTPRETPPTTNDKPPVDDDPAANEPAPPPKQNDDPGCDEVSCVLEKYARPCCAKYKPDEGKFQPSSSENLEKPQIKAGIDRVRPRVIDCGTKHETKGTVKVGVSVSPEGTVEEVTVKEAPDDALGSCVASAVRRAKFAKTTNGGIFTYPFVFN